MNALNRRRFLAAVPGALALAGCQYPQRYQKTFLTPLNAVLNDRFSEWMFSPERLAPEFPDSELVPESEFRLNSFRDKEPPVDMASWRLEVCGLVDSPGRFTLDEIKALPKRNQNTRLVCVEGFQLVINSAGARLHDFLGLVGPRPDARWINVDCADGYYGTIDVRSAYHPQSLLAYEMYGHPLTPPHGAPLRFIIPTKLGYKSSKWIFRMEFSSEPRGFWEEQGYPQFAGI